MATNSSRLKGDDVLTTVSPLVLASGSPRRIEILRSLGFDFEIVPADVDEESERDLKPVQLAVSLAEEKADAVSRLRPHHCVIAADTVVELAGVSVGKPSTAAEAIAMLQQLSGRTHHVHTGMAVRVNGMTTSAIETSEVTMRNLSAPEIEVYVSSGAALDKAGAYGIQDEKLSPVASLTGSYLNVVGLPLRPLARLLLEAGEIDQATFDRISEKDAL